MKLLLDTHIWVWADNHPDKLSWPVKRQLTNPRNEIYLSPVSVWEAGLLHRRNRLRTQRNFAQWLDQALKPPLLEAPLTFAVAIEAAGIDLPQPDPGDVLIAATARVHGLTLVTADPQLLGCSWLKTLSND
ncbi:MAG TPA: type II toxin-antitoxin system VapC family toxin [Candidatus Acidoferrales bacterium]|nr:type II toxin-antitoxin system VapC family toxin [Candidatus Acidoferrales bacterium]